MPVPDGGYQMIIHSRAGEDSGYNHAGKRGAGTALIVSGEAFAALSIGLSLPRPPNPLEFKAHEDEDIVPNFVRCPSVKQIFLPMGL